jgi:TolB protein
MVFSTIALLLIGVHPSAASASDRIAALSPLIGYTELRTDLPGGRLPNVATMRAMIVRPDGADRHEMGARLADEVNSWTQFAGWSPDGTLAILGRGWESAENGAWEEEHKTFRFSADAYLYDCYLVDMETGVVNNVTAPDRVSFYNTGLFFWPNDPARLGFQALINGNSHPFQMNRDGSEKHDLTDDSKEFAYGFSASPDGSRISYHKNYQIIIADSDGRNALHVVTGNPFNFGPAWSPDGSRVVFLSGEHYNSHPYVVEADGTGLRKLADRGGYKGTIEFLDVPDFHGGSSDVPVWSRTSRGIFHTAKVGDRVELFRTSLEGLSEQLTDSPPGTLHYHPQPSPDGEWLVYGSKRDGIRQLYVMRLSDQSETRITNLTSGQAAMWAHWRPLSALPARGN